ncbi:MAG: DUF2953 domain-containing protein [Ruminococcaceae bacterium]|nr:DUF2953 domain-containing protein [Oscillospiraceae bacterium]
MTGWIIAGSILLFLILLLWLPVCVRIGFDGEFTLSVSYLFLKFGIFPKKERKKKTKKKEKKEKVQKQESKQKTKQTFSQKLEKLQSTLESVLELFGAVKGPLKFLLKSIRLYLLELKVIVATDDPCDTAEKYGKTCAAVYPLLSSLRQIKRPKKQVIVIKPDFCEDEGMVSARVKLGIIPWAVIAAVIGMGINYLAIIFKKQFSSGNKKTPAKKRRK